MRKLFLVFCFFTFFLPAQEDYLLMKNGDMFFIKTVSKKGPYITYTMPDEGNNTFHFADKKEVRKWVSARKLERQNARKGIFSKEHPKEYYKHHQAGLDVYAFSYSTLKIHYSIISGDGKIGYHTFAAYNFNSRLLTRAYPYKGPYVSENGNYSFNHYLIAQSGHEMRLWFNYFGKLNIHAGPGIEFGLLKARIIDYPKAMSDEDFQKYLDHKISFKEEWWKAPAIVPAFVFYGHAGLQYRLTNRLIADASVMCGISLMNKRTVAYLNGELNLSYAF